MGRTLPSQGSGSLSNFIFGESNRHVSSGSWGVQSHPRVRTQELKAKDQRLDMKKVGGALASLASGMDFGGMLGGGDTLTYSSSSTPPLQYPQNVYSSKIVSIEDVDSVFGLPAPASTLKSSVVVEDVQDAPFGLSRNDQMRQVPPPKPQPIFPTASPSATDLSSYRPLPSSSGNGFPSPEPLLRASVETLEGEDKIVRSRSRAGLSSPQLDFNAHSKATGDFSVNLLGFTGQVRKDGDKVDPVFKARKAYLKTDTGYTVKANDVDIDGNLLPFGTGGASGSGSVSSSSVTVSNDYLGGASLKNLKVKGDSQKRTATFSSDQLVGRGSMDAEGLAGKVDSVTMQGLVGSVHHDPLADRLSGTMTATETELQMEAIKVNLSNTNVGFYKSGEGLGFEGNVDKLSIFTAGSNPITVTGARVTGRPSDDHHNWLELKARGVGTGYKRDLGPSLHPMHIVAEAPLSWGNTLGNLGGFKSGWNVYKFFKG